MPSFTKRLDDSSDPLRRWFAERLPNTAGLAMAANHELRGPVGTRTGRIVTLGRPDAPPLACGAADKGLAGTALDLLLRTSLRAGALERDVTMGISLEAIQVELDALAQLNELEPWRSDFAADRWAQLATVCVVLARFDQARRSFVASELVAQRSAGVRASVDTYAAALADADVVRDVIDCGPAIVADHADLRDSEPLIIGPTFALSRELGGADADLIAGDLLLDFKATSTTGIVGRAELWQLAGYALADAPDEYGVRRVGISALRWRRRWIIALDDLLAHLSGKAVLRAELCAEMRRAAAQGRPPA